MQAAESSSLQREEIEWEVSQRANARHVSMAFIGWCRLHQVCKQDAQRIGLCRRYVPLSSDMFFMHQNCYNKASEITLWQLQ